ncbi:hypothetical protein YC2023_099371 [Brassica napus]
MVDLGDDKYKSILCVDVNYFEPMRRRISRLILIAVKSSLQPIVQPAEVVLLLAEENEVPHVLEDVYTGEEEYNNKKLLTFKKQYKSQKLSCLLQILNLYKYLKLMVIISAFT